MEEFKQEQKNILNSRGLIIVRIEILLLVCTTFLTIGVVTPQHSNIFEYFFGISSGSSLFFVLPFVSVNFYLVSAEIVCSESG